MKNFTKNVWAHKRFCYSVISQFSMAAISFVIVCKELKISKIVQINQLFQVLNLICTYDKAFYGLITPMLMRKNEKNDVSKDWP